MFIALNLKLVQLDAMGFKFVPYMQCKLFLNDKSPCDNMNKLRFIANMKGKGSK